MLRRPHGPKPLPKAKVRAANQHSVTIREKLPWRAPSFQEVDYNATKNHVDPDALSDGVQYSTG